ncbi:MAG TPA: MarR family transcriptional regulator [Acidimicrobiia bacterium]|nr:MarR family transcriptional regulator [Acidimicrobiia bacterium]
MSEVRWLDETESRAWRGYQAMTDQVTALLQQSMMRQSGLSLSDYAVLVYLSESEDRLRAYELGAALRWEKSRLSHHLRRMEKRGLITRQTCETDGRGLWIVLTARGRQAIEEAAPVHVSDVRRYIIDQLNPSQLEALAEITEKVLGGLPAGDDACAD